MLAVTAAELDRVFRLGGAATKTYLALLLLVGRSSPASQPDLARQTHQSERTVRKALDALDTHHLVAVVRQSGRRSTYQLDPGNFCRGTPATSAGVARAPARVGTGGGTTNRSGKEHSHNGRREQGSRLPAVNRRRMTEAEHDLATAVLAAFNAAADTTYTLVGRARTGIVLRCREHPDLDLREHVSIIVRAFEEPWWEDTPTPQVIYGNPTIFERALQLRRKPVNAGQRSRLVAQRDRLMFRDPGGTA